MLSETQILAFKLHRYLFSYLPYPIPVGMNRTYTEVGFKNSNKSLKHIYLSVLYMFQFALTTTYRVIRYSLFFPRDDFTLTNIILLLGAVGIIFAVSGLTLIFIEDIGNYLRVFNDVFMMEQTLRIGKNEALNLIK